MTITTRMNATPVTKTVSAIRIHVDPRYKPIGVPYWDITAGTLQAQIRPILQRPDFTRLIITIRKYGEAPTARFQVTVR